MIIFTKYRLAIAVLGLSIVLIYGSITGNFKLDSILKEFPTEIIILIFVLSLFTKNFENLGVFDCIKKWMINVSKGKKLVGLSILIFTIYFLSLFMNNLTVILLFAFICIELAIHFKISIIPILVSAIIASNIGGAALPWADTPAVILTLYTDFTLLDFMSKLFIPCFFYILILIVYTYFFSNKIYKATIDTKKSNISFDQSLIKPIPPPPPHKKKLPHLQPKDKKPLPHKNKKIHPLSKNEANLENKKSKNDFILPIILFLLLIIGVSIAPFVNLSIAYIVMFCGSILLLINKKTPEDVINTLTILDSITFIAALFLISAVLEATGTLTIAIDYILSFTGTNSYLIVIIILISAFFIATFLSAGPAAATLLPICTDLSPLVGDKIIYASLALGILAGSSMLPWFATGGPILLAETSRFLKQGKITEDYKGEINSIFNLKKYISFSIPFSTIILFLSGIILCSYIYLL